MLFYSSIFNVKMATQKFTSFNKYFLLIWQLSQYNLTKLFQMKPSYRAILWKNWMNILDNSIFKVYSLMNFYIYLYLWRHHYNQDNKISITPNISMCPSLIPTPTTVFFFLHSRQPLICLVFCHCRLICIF